MWKIGLFIGLFVIGYSETGYCRDCFFEAAKRYSVPEVILRAIAGVESGYKGFVMNVAGSSYYPSSLDEALEVLRANRDKSFDVGIMQVNRWWFDKMGFPYEWGFNSCWNINFGAYVLGYELHRANGDVWVAVGRYHSPNRLNQEKYIAKVAKELGKWQR